MPIIDVSSFRPPALMSAASIQTILPSLARRPADPGFKREILELPDGDFLELDWLTSGAGVLAVVNHGLEGSTASTYLRGMALALRAAGYDVLAWNMRGCGTERNRLKTWYHSGQSDDLRLVLKRALEAHKGPVVLIGFSIGGNILLKYLGEEGNQVSSQVKAAVAISVPMDLESSADELARPSKSMYMSYLLKPLRARILEKAARFPGEFDVQGIDTIRTFHEFDARFTAPFHGFSSIQDYWGRASSLPYIGSITLPTLAVSALDDPFLSTQCFPFETARASKCVFLEVPKHGGHVGFVSGLSLQSTWVERRAIEFLQPYISDQGSARALRVWA
jgi:predicted alpha/beta-fold hydrolase